MSSSTPLIFRPSFPQRAMAMLLFAGSWLVGVRALWEVLGRAPHLLNLISTARGAGEPTGALWTTLVLGFLALLGGGLVLVASLAFLLLVEGCSVLVDELGITVEHNALPAGLARRVGAGRLTWKHVAWVGQKGPFFTLKGDEAAREPGQDPPLERDPVLRFLLVDQLERLVTLILERSPNLKLD